MTPHKQLIRHRPKQGDYGDCQRTVLACLLDKASPEEVPHFLHDDPPRGVFADRVSLWLRDEGYAFVTVLYPGSTPLEVVLRSVGQLNVGIYYMLTGKGRLGCNHVVICLGDSIFHDPSLDNSGVIAPVDDGDAEYWWIEFLTPLRFTEKKAVGKEVREAHPPGGDSLELLIPCPVCNGDQFVSFGDRHVENRAEVCHCCKGKGTMLAETGRKPEAAYDPERHNTFVVEPK